MELLKLRASDRRRNQFNCYLRILLMILLEQFLEYGIDFCGGIEECELNILGGLPCLCSPFPLSFLTALVAEFPLEQPASNPVTTVRAIAKLAAFLNFK